MNGMRDHITKLCEDLIGAEDPKEVFPAAEQLQEAIHDRVERVRQDAVGVVMIDRVIGLEGLIESQMRDFSDTSRPLFG